MKTAVLLSFHILISVLNSIPTKTSKDCEGPEVQPVTSSHSMWFLLITAPASPLVDLSWLALFSGWSCRWRHYGSPGEGATIAHLVEQVPHILQPSVEAWV